MTLSFDVGLYMYVCTLVYCLSTKVQSFNLMFFQYFNINRTI